MELSNQYNIPYADIPRGIELSLINSDKIRTDAEILANEERYNSAIPIITLAVEEFGKALWLSEYFEKNASILHKEGFRIFRQHKQRIKKVLDYVKNTVKQRTMSTRIKKDSTAAFFHIPEEFDDQDFKKRMLYVDYQKTKNPETPWKNQSWKNPLHIEELDFSMGRHSTTLEYKYYDLWRCAFYGIYKFRHIPLYDKILNALPSEEFSFEKIRSYIEKHFLLGKTLRSTNYNGPTMDIHIIQAYPWITPILADIIKEHIQKKYQVKQVHISLDPNY